jgi:hypothetical protein
MDIIEVMHDERLFKPVFRDLETWKSWVVFFKSIFALEMTGEEFELFKRTTGRHTSPTTQAREVFCISGRRSGKSFASALLGVYLGCFVDYSPYLARGERASVMVIGADRKQSRVTYQYLRGLLFDNPILLRQIRSENMERIQLINGVDIEIMTCNFRTLRGRTVACCICDEVAFWHSDSTMSNPDSLVIGSIRPSLATIPGSMLICLSSPYSRKGVLYQAWERNWSKDGNTLVWVSESTLMNPTLDKEFIGRQLEVDPIVGRSEWLAAWREDLSRFLGLDAIRSCCVLPGTLAPRRGKRYKCFVDVSGGRKDWTCFAIGHREGRKHVVDVIRGFKPPFDPFSITLEIAEECSRYGVSEVVGDKYGATWVQTAFNRAGLVYRPCDKVKSDLYGGLEGYINTRQIEIPDSERLVNELLDLERRVSRSGKDRIDHPPSGSDDHANVLAGLCYELGRGEGGFFQNIDFYRRAS